MAGLRWLWALRNFAGAIEKQATTFADVAKVMQPTIFDRPVLDETGLGGCYTFVLRWRADQTQFGQMQGVEMPQEAGTEDVDDIHTSALDQLERRIEAEKAEAAPAMVTESVAWPSAN